MALYLMKTSELEDILSGSPSEICLLDARDNDHYQNSHISGAINLNWSQFCKQAPCNVPDIYRQTGWWGALKNQQELNALDIKIDLDKHLVVYADGASTKGRDGFLSIVLKYLGAKNISIVDGGFSKWQKEGRVISKNSCDTNYSVSRKFDFLDDLFVSAEELEKSMVSDRSPLILDARSNEEFTGKNTDHLNPNGHIPGARLFEYKRLYEANSTSFLSREAYLDLAETQIISQEDQVVVYCEMGLRAATLAVLHEIYTGKQLKVLNGGIFLWSLEMKRPFERLFT